MYRNKKLLNLANESPNCMSCGAYNYGQVISAHADWLEYGKGKGIKAHDCFIAFLCNDCHNYLHHSGDDKELKKAFWHRAYLKTMVWLFENKVKI